MDYIFLDQDDLAEMHLHQIDTYGGEAGIRDVGLLLSALAMPKAMFGGEFLHEDIYTMAAAYKFHIVNNHPFVDGNKRMGTAAALTFLEVNEHVVEIDDAMLIDFVLEVAQSRKSKTQIAEFFRTHARKA